MRSTYDERIHGTYYPPRADGPLPARYAAVVAAARSAHAAPVRVAVEIGPEVPATATFVRDRLGVPSGGYSIVDFSRPALDRLAEAGFSTQIVDVSTERLPYADRSVDLVVFSEVVEHLVDPDHALVEIRRILAPDGVLVATTPNLASWFNRALLLGGVQPIYSETGTQWVFGRKGLVPRARPVGHLRVLTARAFAELLAHHGFEIVRYAGLSDERLAVGHPALAWIDRRLARIPTLAAGILAVARPTPDPPGRA